MKRVWGLAWGVEGVGGSQIGGWCLTAMLRFATACYDLSCQSVLLWRTAVIRSRMNRSVVQRQAHPSLLPEPCLLIHLPVPGHFAGPHISLATRNALLTPLAILNAIKWSKGPIPSLFPVCCSGDRQTVRAWNATKWWLFGLFCPCGINPLIPKSSCDRIGDNICVSKENTTILKSHLQWGTFHSPA